MFACFSTPPYIFQFNDTVFDYEFNKICDILASLYTPTKKTDNQCFQAKYNYLND